MASTVPVVGLDFEFGVCLYSQADTKLLITAPTLAAGDFQQSTNNGAWTNLVNLPAVDPAAGAQVTVVVDATELTTAGAGGYITVKWEDQVGAQWCSGYCTLRVWSADLDGSIAAILLDTGTTLDGRIPAALVGGRMDASVGAIAAGAITAAAIATDAIDADSLKADAVTEIQSGLATSTALATVSTNVSTLLSRMGAFLGTGTNTVLGWLRAIMRKDGTTPSDIGGSYAQATDSLEALHDGGTVTVVSAVDGDEVTVYTYSLWSFELTGLGDISSRTKLYFTVKRDPRGEADSASIYQVEETAGALYVNGAAATASWGTLTVTDETAGDITVTLSATGVGSTSAARGLRWEVKEITASGPSVVSSGPFHIETAVTRAVA